jgi:lipoprotein-anchoring transpeptidase ErfK/SrfK
MNNPNSSINKLITDARRAIEAGRPDDARPLLRQAAHLAPQDSRPWLLLAGIAESSRERRAYLAQARRLDAQSQPAAPPVAAPPRRPRPARQPRRSLWIGAVLLLLLLIGGAVTAFTPAGRSLLGSVAGRVSALAGVGGVATLAPTAAVPSTEPAVAAGASPTAAVSTVEIAPPPTEPPVFPTKGVMPGGQPLPTWTPTSEPTPTLAPTMTPSPTPLPSATPEPIPLTSGAPAARPPGVAEGERWINVNLSTQTLVAYEGDTPVFETLVSSGLPQWPTVTGQYRTYMKYESQTMNGYLLGYDYFLPDVPYVMYFFEDYAIHGTYWHSNFGAPMSHGCVNVSTPDAGWLFNWAPVGTTVNVHY